ncbi:dihydrofolate reductase [Xylella taiwanensis]|uniref:Dihydrofolate reductase n=1 Tax=Xylella taiwanensis TaxID=1444770 RepID=Z9JL85_9GAMM|nr:dihydrofolate reductase [Xylella taiwanensis]AXI83306.1 diacylglycerol kinase [Xylella taiwanensis]EWS79165.1 diacylglycerol kinase [Xylella taiwanensis]MCD8456374.1 dihydrofolate reductase [Xylella taiwanensis]MCD8458782.1 dihydrofolate reductase [Xylella taiwanensis]MCD8460918.1 dihydrofolate reductase [Xylella taiwanensis]
MIVSLIAALDLCYAIGRGNDLPWHLPDDLKRFKALTLGRPVLMGRKTAYSLGRALPGRTNLVLTRSGQIPFPGMRVVDSLDAAIAQAAAEGTDRLSVIGGGELYALTLPYANVLYLTHVDVAVVGADAYFPMFDPADWEIMTRESHKADMHHAYAFTFIDYYRRYS